MKVVCSKQDLLNAVNIVSKAVPANTTMSLLECILMQAGNGEIKLTANDMELGIETVIGGMIEIAGMIAIDAKMLQESVRKLPDGDITIESDDNDHVMITCGTLQFGINGKNGDEFTFLPKVERKDSIQISTFTLRDIIRQTIFSIGNNDTNKVMGGVDIIIKNDQLRVTTLDGHRVSIRKVQLKSIYSEQEIIIPGKALNEISKIIPGFADEMVNIFITDNNIIFEFDNTIVVSRLIDGEYFKLDNMLSTDYKTKIKINKRQLLDSIDRASLMAKEGDKKPIIMDINDININLSITSVMGSMNENISIDKEGIDMRIGFNPKFFMDALKVIDDEEIIMYMVDPKAPCYIRDDNETFIYMILPININSAR